MFANFHTHTKRCGHASGADEDYVKRAIESGLSALGFSDHTPYFYDGDYYSPAKMKPEEMGNYFESILSLREKYKDKIDIKIGFETEYFPKFFDRLLIEYRKFPLDYIILGQHFIGDESTENAESSFGPKTKREPLSRFVSQCIEALNTDRFSCFAHPDVIDYRIETKEDEQYRDSEYEKLIRAAMATKTPLEINLCGVRSRRNYPNAAFWRIVGKLGATVVIGCDAHKPTEIAVPEEIEKAEFLVREYGLKLKDSFPLKNPIF